MASATDNTTPSSSSIFGSSFSAFRGEEPQVLIVKVPSRSSLWAVIGRWLLISLLEDMQEPLHVPLSALSKGLKIIHPTTRILFVVYIGCLLIVCLTGEVLVVHLRPPKPVQYHREREREREQRKRDHIIRDLPHKESCAIVDRELRERDLRETSNLFDKLTRKYMWCLGSRYSYPC